MRHVLKQLDHFILLFEDLLRHHHGVLRKYCECNPVLDNQHLFGFENYKLFETDCFKHFHNLKLLKLENCLISCIKKNLFIGLNNLNELELVSNQIDTIEEKVFEKLSNLNMLDISYNKLRELKKYHFVGLNSLRL